MVHQTLQYILYNFRKKITMQELGARAHVSPNHLSLLFKEATGTTCMQMIADLRLQYEEVKAAKWASLEEILSMIDSGTFIPYHRSLIELLFFLRDHSGTHTR